MSFPCPAARCSAEMGTAFSARDRHLQVSSSPTSPRYRREKRWGPSRSSDRRDYTPTHFAVGAARRRDTFGRSCRRCGDTSCWRRRWDLQGGCPVSRRREAPQGSVVPEALRLAACTRTNHRQLTAGTQSCAAGSTKTSSKQRSDWQPRLRSGFSCLWPGRRLPDKPRRTARYGVTRPARL
jgi:hypothetical protein